MALSATPVPYVTSQQRLLIAISRLAALGDRTIPEADLSCLEALTARMERRSTAGVNGFRPTAEKPRDLVLQDDTDSDTGSDVSWASDDHGADDQADSVAFGALPTMDGFLASETSPGDLSLTSREQMNDSCIDMANIHANCTVRDGHPCEPDVSNLTRPSCIVDDACSVDVDIVVPSGVSEGQHLSVDFAGSQYDVVVPAGCMPGSTFRMALLRPVT
eukprot:TRINITY_DN5377_c0_g2_i2.p1 TRINITY_DN5377_c0_g2~~TRINITY_DN5377_c0_g2_i2.p1  ORF type:complete len:247 (-),score=25.39 TRINITY_DN5377_c0_g2_i2:282-935(-)